VLADSAAQVLHFLETISGRLWFTLITAKTGMSAQSRVSFHAYGLTEPIGVCSIRHRDLATILNRRFHLPLRDRADHFPEIHNGKAWAKGCVFPSLRRLDFCRLRLVPLGTDGVESRRAPEEDCDQQ
jgi:hypothetical protein